MVAATLSDVALTRLRMGTHAAVADAVARIPGMPATVVGGRAVHDSRLAAFLTVGPKFIGIQRTRAHLADEAAGRVLRERSRSIDYDVQKEQDAYRSPMALTDVADMTSAVDVRRARLKKPRTGSRGKITSWTRASRNRMKLTLNQLDWTPMFESGRTPAHVTLTMPGGPSDHWESLCPTPDEWRVFVRKLKLYYLRAWGEPLLGVWKLEFQKRGAPHLHLLMAPPQGVAKSKHAYEFKYWLSYVWADIVNDPDPVEKRKHINAGTSVKLVELEHRGPDSIGDYFAKHGIFDAKEYQNEMPRIWRDAIAGDAPGIQFWGVWGLGKALAAVELNAARDDRGAATLDCITDPFGVERVIRFIIGEELTAAETAPGVTDKTIGRAVQRRLDHLGSQSSDYDKVQRHLRKLAKARHHRQFADMRVKNEHGQWILPGVIRDEFGTPLVNSAGIAVRAPGAPRPIKTPRVDAATGEVRVTTKYRIGTYNGTSGGLCGLDGIQAAHDVHRLIDRRANYDLRA